jgi:IS30 family transposase
MPCYINQLIRTFLRKRKFLKAVSKARRAAVLYKPINNVPAQTNEKKEEKWNARDIEM